MNYSTCYADLVSRVYVTSDARGTAAVRRFRDRLPSVPLFEVESKTDIPEEHCNSRTLLITLPRGNTVGRCPGTRGHLCCNYVTMDLYMGCRFGCSYCIMKYYLNFSPVTVYADSSEAIRAVRDLAERNRGGMLRVGTGEVGDSLLYDPIFELSGELIEALSDLENVRLELKTKSDHVDHLLSVPRKGRAVIGFSVNPDAVVTAEEGTAAPLAARLEAAGRAAEAGFGVAFHFDPVFLFSGWQDAYADVIRRLRAAVPPDTVAWISMGTFRYPGGLKDRIEDRPYLYDEFVPCRDGKFRYIQRVRSRMYRFLRGGLEEAFPPAPLYLCMESPEVWRNAFGSLPGKMAKLRDIFSPVRGIRKHDYDRT